MTSLIVLRSNVRGSPESASSLPPSRRPAESATSAQRPETFVGQWGAWVSNPEEPRCLSKSAFEGHGVRSGGRGTLILLLLNRERR